MRNKRRKTLKITKPQKIDQFIREILQTCQKSKFYIHTKSIFANKFNFRIFPGKPPISENWHRHKIVLPVFENSESTVFGVSFYFEFSSRFKSA